jgi:hypothetical protein
MLFSYVKNTKQKDLPVELEYDINYFNLEGKKLNKNELSKLPNGSVYFRRTLSSKGTYSYKKI